MHLLFKYIFIAQTKCKLIWMDWMKKGDAPPRGWLPSLNIRDWFEVCTGVEKHNNSDVPKTLKCLEGDCREFEWNSFSATIYRSRPLQLIYTYLQIYIRKHTHRIKISLDAIDGITVDGMWLLVMCVKVIRVCLRDLFMKNVKYFLIFALKRDGSTYIIY